MFASLLRNPKPRAQRHISVLYSVLHTCLHTLFGESWVNDKLLTNCQLWTPGICAGNFFQGFFFRVKNLESTADVNSDCIHIRTFEKSRIMDWPTNSLTLKLGNSPRLVCAMFSLFSLPQQLFQERFQRSKIKTCHSPITTLSQTAWNDYVTKLNV